MNRTFFSAWVALSVAASLPSVGLAQDSRLDLTERPSTFRRINEQFDRLSNRIDREVAQGQLVRADAERAHREVNGMQDQVNVDREEHGGRITVAGRFDLQARIERLKDSLRKEQVNVAQPPTT